MARQVDLLMNIGVDTTAADQALRRVAAAMDHPPVLRDYADELAFAVARMARDASGVYGRVMAAAVDFEAATFNAEYPLTPGQRRLLRGLFRQQNGTTVEPPSVVMRRLGMQIIRDDFTAARVRADGRDALTARIRATYGRDPHWMPPPPTRWQRLTAFVVWWRWALGDTIATWARHDS